RLIHPDPDAVAGDARLGHLEYRASDPVAVADADDVVRQSFDREVLAELAGDEIGPLQLVCPVAIRFDLIDENSALFTAVSSSVALTVALEVQPSDAAPAAHGTLPDSRMHRTAFPLDIARETDVDRQEPVHGP